MAQRASARNLSISIHALREEGDVESHFRGQQVPVFLSTPPARRATTRLGYTGDTLSISIHAPREEGDCLWWPLLQPARNFYPRPPRGGRLVDLKEQQEGEQYFYPRPPRGGRPAALVHFAALAVISIHAPREEGDHANCQASGRIYKFLSTPPARRATAFHKLLRALAAVFLSTPPARRATWCLFRFSNRGLHFYPRPPRGGRHR